MLSEHKEGLDVGTILQVIKHYWANVDLTPNEILISYLALWLMRCVVASAPRERLTLKNLCLVVLLASG